METQCRATFQVTNWDEAPVDERPGTAKVTRAAVTKTYDGDITGSSVTEWLMAYADSGDATFVGLERVVGTVSGRDGSLVLEHVGTFADGAARALLRSSPGPAPASWRRRRGTATSSPTPRARSRSTSSSTDAARATLRAPGSIDPFHSRRCSQPMMIDARSTGMEAGPPATALRRPGHRRPARARVALVARDPPGRPLGCRPLPGAVGVPHHLNAPAGARRDRDDPPARVLVAPHPPPLATSTTTMWR